MQQYSKCKDTLPVDTINKIKSILAEADVIPAELPWNNSVNGNVIPPVFVKRLFYCDETVGSNGKGTSEEYCMASAYAEFIERLQNLSLTKGLNVKIPDKKGIPQEEFIRGQDNLVDEKFFRYLYSDTGIVDNDSVPLIEIIKKLQNFVKHDSSEDLDCVPFYDVKNNKIKYLPLDVLIQVNTTNGMSAGNTPQEAIIQGICEIIERYVQKNIYLKQLNCPVIDEKEYIEYEDIAKIISFYNKIGVKVQVRDASLGEGWPAVCVVFINAIGKYTMKYAASTSFPVAIERCLTEFAQCQDLYNNRYFLPHFSLIEDKEFWELDEVSKINVFNTHCFPFSNTFFTSDKYDWNYDSSIWNSNPDNTVNLKNLVNIILNHSFDIYIRDVSFLGFPSYHIHIPEMSNFLINVVKDLENQFVEIKPYFEKYIENFNLRYAVPYIFNFYHELTLAVSLSNKNYEKALKEVDKLIDTNKSSSSIPILCCIQQYIKLQINNCPEKQIYDTLCMFFGEQITKHVYNYCIDSNYVENVVQVISKSINNHLKTEKMQKICTMERELSDKLTIKYAANTPNQSLLSGLFY